MDLAVEKDIWWFLGQFWSTVVVALIIYTGGIIATRIIVSIWPQTEGIVSGRVKQMDPKMPFAFRMWHATYLAHPFIVGALLGLLPDLPRPDFINSRTSTVLWFGFAGLGNGQIHMLMDAATRQLSNSFALVVPWVRQRLGINSGGSTEVVVKEPPKTEKEVVAEPVEENIDRERDGD